MCKDLFMKDETCFDRMTEEEHAAAQQYAEGYMRFLDASKTEREAVAYAIRSAEAFGYRPFQFGMPVRPGDRYYYNNRGKSVYLFRIGTGNIENDGIRIAAAHVDSPRLDLKPCPLYEESGMSFMKTHYYGGIKKYQWTTIPLALHGVVVCKNGKTLNVCIGEDPGDPVFYVNDLLPHLAYGQMDKRASDLITGEQLNLLVGSKPDKDADSDPIKANILNLLNHQYGITEEDFLSAELSAVPAFKARMVGLDSSLIGAYGHDDRVCAYPAITALFDLTDESKTVMAILADKEEIGSEGTSGMKCAIFTDLLTEICEGLGANVRAVRAASKCLSADVNAAYDPNFPEVFEKRNSSQINRGAVITKYTGSRGKSGSSDASAELVAWVRSILDAHNVVWQVGELGKVDVGGGGTVAKYIAEQNIETVDLGVPVISMHAPFEVIAVNDLYMTYRCLLAFYE